MIDRRRMLLSLAGLPLIAMSGCKRTATRQAALRITIAGQALMSHPLCAQNYAGFAGVVAELKRGDIVFSDLEVAIKTADSGAATRSNEFLHAASTGVLTCLREMGLNLLALSNNHAWDLGSEGVLATRKAVMEHGFAAAGTGANLDEASAPAVMQQHGRRIALVALATEKIRDGAAATATRAGVNELRLDNGVPHVEDATRVLSSVRKARQQADVVIVYHHNHDWGDDMRVTRPWAQTFARECADAGADIYVSHGAPLLHGIETYNDSVLFFGLGSLVFHSRTEIGHYPPEVWESLIAHCEYVDGLLHSVEIVPVVLNERGDDALRQNQTRGRPRIASGADAERILRRLQRLTAGTGSNILIEGDRASLQLPHL
jgi:poly-gamma-glutamate synthesis protein (capsule biosynthesis protein)